jgi:hypothetical protein
MKHEKTFAAIEKLKDVEIELHRLKNALEMASKALDAQRPWVGLTDEEMRDLEKQFEAERVRTSDEEYLVIYPAAYWQWQRAIEAKLKQKNGYAEEKS